MIAGSFFFFLLFLFFLIYTRDCFCFSNAGRIFHSLPHLSQFIYTGINRFHPGQVQELAKCLVSFVKTKDGNDDGFTLLQFITIVTI